MNNKQYRRTLKGLIVRMYANQCTNSKRRGHSIGYTKKELEAWLLAQPAYHEMHALWVSFCYYKWLVPSVDRLDDTKGYSFDNIQLVTWYENAHKAGSAPLYKNKPKRDSNKPFISKPIRPVQQFTKEGELIATYKHAVEASKITGLSRTGISKACNGKSKYSHGFTWKFLTKH